MNDDTDASNGDESLTIEQATAAFLKANPPEVQTDQAEAAPDESDTTDDTEQASSDASEDDGETDSTDQAEDGEDVPESEQGRFVGDNAKVRLADGTVTTIGELKQGSLRQADYTRKTQEASTIRKEAESQSAATKQRETQLAEREAYAATLIQSIIPQAPDPAMLQTDPVGYMQAKANHEAWHQHLGTLTQQQQRFVQERQADAEKQAKERADSEWSALTQKRPELKDQAKAKAFGDKLLTYGKAAAFSEDELRYLLPTDHRFAEVLEGYGKWRDLQASKPKVQQKVEGRPPVQKGGKRLSPSESKARQASEALTQLKRDGSVDSAARAWLATHPKG